jgi:hypothetical protein
MNASHHHNGGHAARLGRIGVPEIARALERIARQYQAQNLIVLCHESAWQQCHRYLFAQFWMATTGELVREMS